MKYLKSLIDSVRLWMFVLKIQDRETQKAIQAEQDAINAHQRTVDAMNAERLAIEQNEHDLRVEIGEQILKDAELCIAKYGKHAVRESRMLHWVIHADKRSYSDTQRCKRCSVLVLLRCGSGTENDSAFENGTICQKDCCRDFNEKYVELRGSKPIVSLPIDHNYGKGEYSC